MNSYKPSIRPFGTHAVLMEWPAKVEEAILYDMLRFSQFLKKECLNQNDWEFVSAYNSLTIINRKLAIEFDSFKSQLEHWYEKNKDIPNKKSYVWRLPVCYDLNFAIDIIEVADALECSVDEVIKRHTSQSYTVFGIGFLPGFMYLGGLPSNLEVPRRAEPRLKVTKGAVGLAGKQTGIYPQESPGGWNIIGNCSVPIFNIENDEPCLVNVGDKIKFYSISRAEYDLHKIEAEVGIYQYEKIELNA